MSTLLGGNLPIQHFWIDSIWWAQSTSVRDNVLTFHLGQVMPALAADADAGNVQFAAGRRGAVQAKHGARHDRKTGAGNGAAAQKLTARELGFVGGWLDIHSV